jgi:S2P endopeptidase
MISSIRYLNIATFSLYLFNLLPLPWLDGAQFLSVVLDIIFRSSFDTSEVDLRALEGASPRRRGGYTRWKQIISKLVILITTATVGVSVTLTLLNSL